MIWGSGGSKSRLAKAAGAEPAGQMRDEKLLAVVARSTFGSQNVKSTRWFGPLLEVAMSKKCTPLWRKAHLQVKKRKTLHVGPLLEVEIAKFHKQASRVYFIFCLVLYFFEGPPK